jgi:Trk K+ transport system NAD-binding subunit
LIKEKSEVYKVPDGNTVLDEGDKLVIITKTTSNADILQLFGADE